MNNMICLTLVASFNFHIILIGDWSQWSVLACQTLIGDFLSSRGRGLVTMVTTSVSHLSETEGVGNNVCQLFCVKLYLLVLATLVNFLERYKNHHLRQGSERILIRTWLLYGWRKSDKIEISSRSVSRWLILSGDIVTLQIPGPGTVTQCDRASHTLAGRTQAQGLRQQRLICACFIFQH